MNAELLTPCCIPLTKSKSMSMAMAMAMAKASHIGAGMTCSGNPPTLGPRLHSLSIYRNSR